MNYLKSFLMQLWIGSSIIAAVVLLAMCFRLAWYGVEYALYYESPHDPLMTLKDKPKFKISEMNTSPGDNALKPVIAIYRKNLSGEWTYYCTAFVVTNAYALTASHCLMDGKTGELATDELQIRNIDLKPTNTITAKAASINSRADVGVVLGDFSAYKKLNIVRQGFFGHKGPYVSCGFPYGETPPLCIPFIPITNYFFKVKGHGALFPGMSGGPVIDVPTNDVVGLNLLAENEFVAVAPMIGIVGALQLELEE